MQRLTHHRMTPAFASASLRPGAVAMGHFLNIDHFHMSEPTFPPHPHAGFSAITWMLPWSPGGFANRDSHGDRSEINPGSLHWTLAGSGILHEEIPKSPGTDCEGLQIFVKLPEAIETMPAAAYHLDSAEIPRVKTGGGIAQVLVGSLEGQSSPIPSHARTTMFHLDLSGEGTLTVPSGVEAFAVVLRGAGFVDGARLEADCAVPLSSPASEIRGEMAILIAWSETMASTPTFAGPFCMFVEENLAKAHESYHSGAMGSVAASDVRWVRANTYLSRADRATRGR